MLLGYTLVVDLTTAPACFVGGVLTLALAARLGSSRFHQDSVWTGARLNSWASAVACLQSTGLRLAVTLGYSLVTGFEHMHQGTFGITWPRINVAGQLLFGLYRGLLNPSDGSARFVCDGPARAEHSSRGRRGHRGLLLIPLDQCELLLLGWWLVDRATPARPSAAALPPPSRLRPASRRWGPDGHQGPARRKSHPVP
jgi:hypothetical protein